MIGFTQTATTCNSDSSSEPRPPHASIASMNGWKLLIVQSLLADGRTPDGEPQLAVDNLGAGIGRAR